VGEEPSQVITKLTAIFARIGDYLSKHSLRPAIVNSRLPLLSMS
jgi:hypothetical protein